MARLPELARVAREHDLKLISIADLIEYRRKQEKLVNKVGEATSFHWTPSQRKTIVSGYGLLFTARPTSQPSVSESIEMEPIK